MDKYAIIENGVVINVIEYPSQPTNPPPGFPQGVTAVLANGAGPNWAYKNNIFTPPQPYPSWTLVNNVWTPPVPYPTTGGPYVWNEPTKSWASI